MSLSHFIQLLAEQDTQKYVKSGLYGGSVLGDDRVLGDTLKNNLKILYNPLLHPENLSRPIATGISPEKSKLAESQCFATRLKLHGLVPCIISYFPFRLVFPHPILCRPMPYMVKSRLAPSFPSNPTLSHPTTSCAMAWSNPDSSRPTTILF